MTAVKLKAVATISGCLITYLNVLHDRGLCQIKITFKDMWPQCAAMALAADATSHTVSVATRLQQIIPDVLSKKTGKNSDKETI